MTSDAMREYLLSALDDDRVVAVEETLLADREALELLEEVETDLVDDYAGDRLSPSDRRRFERHYLVSDYRRQRVAVARALFAPESPVAASPVDHASAWSSQQTEGHASAWPRSLVWATAAMLLIGVAGGWFVTSSRRSMADNAGVPAVADVPSTASPAAPAPSGTVAPPSPAPLHLALVLPAISTRDRVEQTPRVGNLKGVAFVDLLIEGVAPALVTARAEIRSVDDRVVWSGAAAAAAATTTALVSVPAERLTPDDYILTLTDRNRAVLGRYFFRVTGAR